MALSIFDDKSVVPADNQLPEILGENSTLWNSIKEFVYARYPAATEEWNFPGEKYGWSFRIKDKKRAIIYFIPHDGFFQVALVYGAKATEEALAANISDEIKEAISSAKVYAEGRGFSIDVKDAAILDNIKTLVEIKLRN